MIPHALIQMMPLLKNWLTPHTIDDVIQLAQNLTGHQDMNHAVSVFENKPELALEFQKRVFDLSLQREKIVQHGVNQARKRDQILFASKRNIRADMMVGLAVIGLVVTLIPLVTGHMCGEIVGILSTIAGIFGACLKDAYAFEFGSSRGSKDKDESMNFLIKSHMQESGRRH